MTPFVGQIMRWGRQRPPAGWLVCDGSLVDQSKYGVLFQLIGYTYGGGGANFALPDLRGRVPVGLGQAPGMQTYSLGQTGGAETVALGAQNYPTHSHLMLTAAAPGTTNAPSATVILADAATPGTAPYAGAPMAYAPYDGSQPTVTLHSSAVGPAGDTTAATPHENRQPYMAINYVIAFQGQYPT